MALDLVDYEQKAREAVQLFWGNRAAARQKQIEAGKADQGERAGVTAGKNMDGFLALVLDIIWANGLAQAEIHQNRAMLTLPGYFRPTKLWDLLVTCKGELVAAIELKSHVGPSFAVVHAGLGSGARSAGQLAQRRERRPRERDAQGRRHAVGRR